MIHTKVFMEGPDKNILKKLIYGPANKSLIQKTTHKKKQHSEGLLRNMEKWLSSRIGLQRI